MSRIWHSFIRASAFFQKELAEVLRQPRLILSLIFGPFLILLLFGIGYRDQARTVRALFIADPGSPQAQKIQAYASSIGPQLHYSGVTSSLEDALNQLRHGQVDLVVVPPANAAQTIRSNQQAMFTLYHNEIDPAQASYMEYLGQLYIDEVNRRVISSMASQGQTQAASVQADLKSARQNAQAMKSALQQGNAPAARASQQKMQSNVSSLAVALGASASLFNGIDQNFGGAGGSQANNNLSSTLNDLQQNSSQMDIPDNSSSYAAQIAQVDKSLADINQLSQEISTFQSISPEIMVRPFGVETRTIAKVQISALDFFTPAVIALLLQHIAITIAALSIVRERRSGTMELFRVSPVSSMETLIGKYVSYLILGAFVGTVLAALIYFFLGVPMLGSWTQFALIGLALLFASLGYGFVLSLLSETESQAVQFAMIALLLSVFFSGFILDLRYFWPPIRIISYFLPATYAISLFQNVMLRGLPPSGLFLGGLLGIGIILFLAAWVMLRRIMAQK